MSSCRVRTQTAGITWHVAWSQGTHPDSRSSKPGLLRGPDNAASRAYDWLRASQGGLVFVALVVGAGAGAGAVIFRYLIEGFTLLFTGHLDYTVLGRVANPHVPFLGSWYVIVVPVIGGLIFGPLIERYAREARGHGVPEVMLAVFEKGGRIRPRVAVVKSLASALSIGSGGSVGREGPIVQIGSALGSSIGQLLRVPDSRLRLLVACGAAGGISATFNAPIAGVFFGLEVILLNFEARSFGVVVLSSVTADVIGRSVFGTHPFLSLPGFSLISPWEYALYALLGLIAAFVGVGFIRVLYGMEDLFDRIWRGPAWLRPAVGGLVLGGLIFIVPQMYGVGYPVLDRMVSGQYVAWFLLVLLVSKVVATSLTLSSGGSGGVFAPSLFMGAAVGTAFGDLVHGLLPAVTGPAGAYGLVGMAAVFAAAARAPITAVLIIFELTGDYRIILPLMFAVALATGISSRLSRDTIYTLKLRRRGIDLMAAAATDLMDVLKVEDAMRPVPGTVPATLAVGQLPARLAAAGADALPVVDHEGSYRGIVTTDQVQAAMSGGDLGAAAGDLAALLPTVSRGQTLQQALGVLVTQERSEVPVVEGSGRQIVGWLGHRDVLLAYTARLQKDAERASSGAGRHQGAGPPTVPSREPAAFAVAPSSSAAELGGYRILDVEVKGRSPMVGKPLNELDLPAFSSVIAVRRDDEAFEPDETTVVTVGDRLTILVPESKSEALADALDDD